jgi:hypothetical protein
VLMGPWNVHEFPGSGKVPFAQRLLISRSPSCLH